MQQLLSSLILTALLVLGVLRDLAQRERRIKPFSAKFHLRTAV